MTFHLHVRRGSQLIGEGFYTIGPCGEELLGAVGLRLEDGDDAALHYRHLATNVVRSLRRGDSGRSAPQGRGATSSRRGPGCGGFIVVSVGPTTGSSRRRSRARRRAPSAGPSPTPSSRGDDVSVASVRVRGATAAEQRHFLSAVNAEYFRTAAPLPVVFGVADNDASISRATLAAEIHRAAPGGCISAHVTVRTGRRLPGGSRSLRVREK